MQWLVQVSFGGIPSRKFLGVLYCFCFCSYALGVPAADFFRDITVKNCGTSISKSDSPDRIVGGKFAEHGDYPWMVLLLEDGVGFEQMCGGSVLNEDWIITAAHCLDTNNDPSKYHILVGLHKLSEENDPTVQKIQVSKIVIHKNYDDTSLENDIALIKTAKPINIAGSKGYVNGICLPTTNDDPTGFAKVIGWGHTRDEGENSDTLREVVVPMIPRDECNGAYDFDPDDEIKSITDGMICAGKRNKDSCQNDSGGPLFQTNSDGVSTLIGIVSHGRVCGYSPGVYTKVSSYLKWMKDVVSK